MSQSGETMNNALASSRADTPLTNNMERQSLLNDDIQSITAQEGDVSQHELLIPQTELNVTAEVVPEDITFTAEAIPPVVNTRQESRDFLDSTFYQQQHLRDREIARQFEKTEERWVEARESTKTDIVTSVRGSFDSIDESVDSHYPIPRIFRRLNFSNNNQNLEAGSNKELTTPIYDLQNLQPLISPENFSEAKDGFVINQINQNTGFQDDREAFVGECLENSTIRVGSTSAKQIFNDIFHTSWYSEDITSATGKSIGVHIAHLIRHNLDLISDIPNIAAYFMLGLGHLTKEETEAAIEQLKCTTSPGDTSSLNVPKIDLSAISSIKADGSLVSAEKALSEFTKLNQEQKNTAEEYYSLSTKINNIMVYSMQEPIKVVLSLAGVSFAAAIVWECGPVAYDTIKTTLLGAQQTRIPSPFQVLDMNSLLAEQQKTSIDGTTLSKEDSNLMKNLDLRYIAFRRLVIKVLVSIKNFNK